MGLRFESPLWLIAVLAALPLAWIGLRWFAAMSRVRRWSAVVARTLLTLLLAALLAGAAGTRPVDRFAVVFVVDVSGSVRRYADGSDGPPLVERARSTIDRLAAGRGPDDLLGVVVFDGSAAAVALPTRGDITGRSLDVRLREGTDVASSLRFAASLIPADAAGRLVLVSDGVETTGDARAAAHELAGRFPTARGARGSLPVDAVPVEYEVRGEVMVEHVDAPPAAASESTVTVRVVLAATDPARGTLHMLRDGEPIDMGAGAGAGRALSLAPGRHVELVRVALPPARVHRFEAVWEPETAEGPDGTTLALGDSIPENNRAEAFTVTPGRGSVLLLDGVSDGRPGEAGSTLARSLEQAGIGVTVLPPPAAPSDPLSLQLYDLVILQNVPADALDPTAQHALAAHVRDLGAGLVMIGGPDSFGPGGWKGTPIEPILPVSLDLPESLIVPSAAIVLVIDNSGSMGRGVFGSSRTQQQIANEAAAHAVTILDRADLVGVIAFSNAPRVVHPLSPNSDPATLASRIRGISPGGGTNLLPALEEAARQLESARAEVRHVIVLSDGVSMNAELLPGAAADLFERGIRVSTISVGQEADIATMSAIAEQGGGQHHYVVNPNALPSIFVKTVRLVRSPMIREAPFRPVVTPSGSPMTESIGTPPMLGGLVLTQTRREPTIISAMLTPDGEPLLAHWNVGLGQVAAFTSDAHHWAARWLDWPGYARMWTQVVRTLSRPATTHGYDLMTLVRDGRLRVRFEAADDAGTPLDALAVDATVYGPGEEPTTIRLDQTGPGVYEGSVEASRTGAYVAVVKPRQAGRPLPPAIGGTTISSGEEYRSLRSNAALLRDVASITGGRVLTLDSLDAATVFDRAAAPPRLASAPLWRHLLIAAIVVLMLDVGTRRIAWDRFVSREFGVELRRAAAEALADRGEEARRTLAGLRGTREAARAEPRAGTLGEAEARRITEEAARRRVRDREEALRAIREQRTKVAPREDAAGYEQAKPRQRVQSEDATPSGGLLEAKRRARERIERQQEDEE